MAGKRWLTFVVERIGVYPYNQAPIKQIFGPTATPCLNPLTCTGVFHQADHNYDYRLVVYTKLACL